MDFLVRLKGYFNQILGLLDNGKFFSTPIKWLYVFFAVISALLPICGTYYFYDTVLGHYLAGGWDKTVGIIMSTCFLAIMLCTAYFFFTFWMNRKNRLSYVAKDGEDLVAVPLVANFIQCWFEWIGFMAAIMGASIGLLSLIFFLLTGNINSDIFVSTLIMIIGSAIGGWFIIIFGRYMSEFIILMANMANDIRYYVNKERKADGNLKEN